MAKPRGKPFSKGHQKLGGRKKGTPDKVPATFKASIKAMYEKLVSQHPADWERAIMQAVRKGGSPAFQHVQLALHVLDGKPRETIQVEPDRNFIMAFETADPKALSDSLGYPLPKATDLEKLSQEELDKLAADQEAQRRAARVAEPKPEDPEQEVVVRQPAPVRGGRRGNG